MGCGCRKSQYPKKKFIGIHKNKISSKSVKNIKEKIEAASKYSPNMEEKKMFICNQCNHKVIYNNKDICSISNKSIEDISKNREFSCPLNKFLKY